MLDDRAEQNDFESVMTTMAPNDIVDPTIVAGHGPSTLGGGLTASRRPALWMAFLLGVVCLLVYNANFRQIGAGDTLSARYLPLGIWRYGTLELDPIRRWVAHGHSMISKWDRRSSNTDRVEYFEPWAYWMIHSRHDHLVSLYPMRQHWLPGRKNRNSCDRSGLV